MEIRAAGQIGGCKKIILDFGGKIFTEM